MSEEVFKSVCLRRNLLFHGEMNKMDIVAYDFHNRTAELNDFQRAMYLRGVF